MGQGLNMGKFAQALFKVRFNLRFDVKKKEEEEKKEERNKNGGCNSVTPLHAA